MLHKCVSSACFVKSRLCRIAISISPASRRFCEMSCINYTQFYLLACCQTLIYGVYVLRLIILMVSRNLLILQLKFFGTTQNAAVLHCTVVTHTEITVSVVITVVTVAPVQGKLFEEIADGLKRAKVVIVCASDEVVEFVSLFEIYSWFTLSYLMHLGCVNCSLECLNGSTLFSPIGWAIVVCMYGFCIVTSYHTYVYGTGSHCRVEFLCFVIHHHHHHRHHHHTLY